MTTPIDVSVTCPFCSVQRFSESTSLLTHLNTCVFELYTEDPTNFLCKLCNVKQSALLPALSHAQQCGKIYCDMFYKSNTPTIVTPIQATLVEPVSFPFILPSDDPFPPDHFELSIRGELTSRFIQQFPTYCGIDLFGPVSNILSVPWDFLYNRHMKKNPPHKNGVPQLPNLTGFRRGDDYNRVKHIHRRFRVLGSSCDATTLANIGKMDHMIHKDLLRVARLYLSKFILDYFKEYLLRYRLYFKQENPTKSLFHDTGNLNCLKDCRTAAKTQLHQYGNPLLFQILYQSFLRVKLAFRSDLTSRIVCGWVLAGRNIVITERSPMLGVAVHNFARREVGDCLATLVTGCFGKMKSTSIILHSLKSPPSLKSTGQQVIFIDSPSSEETSSSSSSTTTDSVSQSDALYGLGIQHDDQQLAHGGMTDVRTPEHGIFPFSDLKQEHSGDCVYPPVVSNRTHPGTRKTSDNGDTTIPPTLLRNHLLSDSKATNDSISADTDDNADFSGNQGLSIESDEISDQKNTAKSYVSNELLVTNTNQHEVQSPVKNATETIVSHSDELNNEIDIANPKVPSPVENSTETIISPSDELNNQIDIANKITNPKVPLPVENSTETIVSHSDVLKNQIDIANKINEAIARKATAAHNVSMASKPPSKKSKRNKKKAECRKKTPVSGSPSINNVIPPSTTLLLSDTELGNGAPTPILPAVVVTSVASKPPANIIHSTAMTTESNSDDSTTLTSSPNPGTDDVISTVDPVASKVSTTVSSKNNAYARSYAKKPDVATHGLCPNHPLCVDSLREVNKPTNSYYQYDYSMCSGFDLLLGTSKASCSKSKPVSKNVVHACTLCYQLPKGDVSRFFFCDFCNGQYHLGEMSVSPPHTRKRNRNSN